MRVALICSAHGYGHTGRQLALAKALVAEGAAVSLFTAVPRERLTGDLGAVEHVPWTVDVGIRQVDSRTEDPDGTVAAVEAAVGDAPIDRLAARLRGFDHAVVDIAPAGLEACRRAGVPAVAVGNFDWPWVYAHYPALRRFVAPWRAWQASHPAWALTPGPGLSGFARVTQAGLLGRRRPAVRVAERAVLVSFGGFGLDGLASLLPRVDGVTWVVAAPVPELGREDVRRVDGGSYAGLVAGADLVFTKPGYGIYAECVLAGTPMVWLDRGGFPEAPWLEAAMTARGDEKVGAAGLAAAVAARLARPRPAPVEDPTAHRLARALVRG